MDTGDHTPATPLSVSLDAVSLSVHDVVSEGAQDVNVYLCHIGGGEVTEVPHGLVHTLTADLSQVEHVSPHLPTDGVRDALAHPAMQTLCASKPGPVAHHVAPLEGPLSLQLGHLLRNSVGWQRVFAGGRESSLERCVGVLVCVCVCVCWCTHCMKPYLSVDL